jgi:hypothetical protein
MLFANLLFAIALTVVWPLGMLGLLAACAWLERRTLIPEEVVPRRIRRMAASTPEAVEAMVLQETHEVVAAYWSSPDHPYVGAAPSSNGQRQPAADAKQPAAGPPATRPAPAATAPPAAGPGPADAGPPATRPEAEPADQASKRRVVPGRAARLAGRWPARGRHERR